MISVLALEVFFWVEVSTCWEPSTSESMKKSKSWNFGSWLSSNTRYGYGAEHILSMRVVLADGRIAEVTPEKTKVSESCSSGKNFPSRFSLHDQARCSTRRTITSSLHWEELDPAMELSHNSGISDAASAYIWNQDSTKKKISQSEHVSGTLCTRHQRQSPQSSLPGQKPPMTSSHSKLPDRSSRLWLVRVQAWFTPNNGFKNHLSMPQASRDYSISLSMETISLTNGKLKYIKQ